MFFAFRRASFALSCTVIGGLAIAALTGSAALAAPQDPYKVGTRNGPFVVSVRPLGELVKNGYEIKANLGNALILQKAASVFSCVIPPDPEHMSYRSYFVCSELQEKFGHSGKADKPSSMSPVPDAPRLKMDKPKS